MSFDPSAEYCYLTTTGRRTGRPHTIEIWFGAAGDTLYLLSGGGFRSDWVANLRRDPQVGVRVSGRDYRSTARILDSGEEERMARRLLAAKYQGWAEGQPMSGWAATALPVAIDLPPDAGPG